MGWAGGTELAEEVWRLFRKYVPEEERTVVAKQLIEAFRDEDWDTVDEAETLATDARWYNEEEYDAICVASTDNQEDGQEEILRSDDPYHDTDCSDDEGPIPR